MKTQMKTYKLMGFLNSCPDFFSKGNGERLSLRQELLPQKITLTATKIPRSKHPAACRVLRLQRPLHGRQASHMVETLKASSVLVKMDHIRCTVVVVQGDPAHHKMLSCIALYSVAVEHLACQVTCFQMVKSSYLSPVRKENGKWRMLSGRLFHIVNLCVCLRVSIMESV